LGQQKESLVSSKREVVEDKQLLCRWLLWRNSTQKREGKDASKDWRRAAGRRPLGTSKKPSQGNVIADRKKGRIRYDLLRDFFEKKEKEHEGGNRFGFRCDWKIA